MNLLDTLTARIAEAATDREDLILLVDYMVGETYNPSEIADAVRKPWQWREELAQAKADLTGRDAS